MSRVHRLVDRDIDEGSKANHSIIRWVLNGVKGYVTKVALVAYPITSAERGFAVAQDVPCKANPGTPVVVVWLPEHPAVFGELNTSVANLLVLISSRTKNEVGIERWIGIVLYAVVLPAET